MTQGGSGDRWLGSIRHRSQEAELLKEEEERGGGGGLLPGQVFAAFGGADHRVCHRGQDWVQQRFVEQNFEALGVSLEGSLMLVGRAVLQRHGGS